jgi:hypothetical protein
MAKARVSVLPIQPAMVRIVWKLGGGYEDRRDLTVDEAIDLRDYLNEVLYTAQQENATHGWRDRDLARPALKWWNPRTW